MLCCYTSLDFHRPDTTSVHSRILTNIAVAVALQEFVSGILVGPLGCSLGCLLGGFDNFLGVKLSRADL